MDKKASILLGLFVLFLLVGATFLAFICLAIAVVMIASAAKITPSIGQKKDENLEQINQALLLDKEEEIKETIDAVYADPNTKGTNGKIVLTRKRFFFIQFQGIFTKSIHVIASFPYSQIVGLSISGSIFKKIVLSIEKESKNYQAFLINVRNPAEVIETIRDLKRKSEDKKTITAKTVIIEEKEAEKAEEVLKKKLAKGEITTEEFHKRIQRM